MTNPDIPTSSNVSLKPILVRWCLALAVIFGILLFIYFSWTEKSNPSDEAAIAPEIAEPVNVVEQEKKGAGVDETSVAEEEPAVPAGTTYFVSLSGSDKNDGRSVDQPFASIQRAVDMARPGDTIRLSDGRYMQDIVSRSDGTSEKRITLTGSSKAIVQGGGNGRVIEINHDYLTLEGFTVDGHFKPEEKEKSYRDKLIFVLGKEPRKGVVGLRIEKMTIQNSGGECVRLRYFAEKNEIANSTIRNCGRKDFSFDGEGKNGEGIYVGTAPEQRKDGTNPTNDVDVSENNWIHHNTFDTDGNECVDIKEGSRKNIVEYNSCTGQRDKESGGMGSRGNENVFRHNEIFGNRGAGIRLGGDNKEYGINNFIHNNALRDNSEGGIKIMRKPQAKICDNTFSSNKEGKFVGEYGDDFKDESCS